MEHEIVSTPEPEHTTVEGQTLVVTLDRLRIHGWSIPEPP
jgi:hypothetical protein